MYLFKEGFCWSDINTTYLKCRKKGKSINDVKSMSLYSVNNIIPEYFIICLINSSFISQYIDNFVNNTQTFQINDARQIPIMVPDKENMKNFENIFINAFNIKKKQFSNKISLKTAKTELSKIQEKLDNIVLKLYQIV